MMQLHGSPSLYGYNCMEAHQEALPEGPRGTASSPLRNALVNSIKYGVVSHGARPAPFRPTKGPSASAAAAATLPPASPHLALTHPTDEEGAPLLRQIMTESWFSWVFRYLTGAALNRDYANVIWHKLTELLNISQLTIWPVKAIFPVWFIFGKKYNRTSFSACACLHQRYFSRINEAFWKSALDLFHHQFDLWPRNKMQPYSSNSVLVKLWS